jgi:hypothetical protein
MKIIKTTVNYFDMGFINKHFTKICLTIITIAEFAIIGDYALSQMLWILYGIFTIIKLSGV